MSQRSSFEIAALASAAMPTLTVATTRRSEQFVLSGDKDGITTAVVTDTAGEEYDASICDTADGKERLKARARAAYVLDNTHEPSALGFQLDQLKVFVPGDDPTDATGNTAVLITPHINGDAFQLSGLTEAQCAAAGTSIGAIHRLRGKFIVNARYPAHASAQIHQQLEQWITSLKAAGHIPGEILKNWTSIISNENLWNFRSCPVHGGFSDGDILFTSTGVSGIRHWEDMQINDPARDLAWIFTELDPTRRNSVIAAYARIMGKRMDDMIMLRAGLWVQMSQVGDFIRALERADTQKIMRFKSQVESLAHEISLLNPSGSSPSADPSTLTVGDLLSSSGGRAGAHSQPHRTNPGAPHGPSDKGSSPDRDSAPGQEDTRLDEESPLPEASSRQGYSRFVADSGIRTPAGSSFDPGDGSRSSESLLAGDDSDNTVVGLSASSSRRTPHSSAFLGRDRHRNGQPPAPKGLQHHQVAWNSVPEDSQGFRFTTSDDTPAADGGNGHVEQLFSSSADDEETAAIPHIDKIREGLENHSAPRDPDDTGEQEIFNARLLQEAPAQRPDTANGTIKTAASSNDTADSSTVAGNDDTDTGDNSDADSSDSIFKIDDSPDGIATETFIAQHVQERQEDGENPRQEKRSG